MKCWSLYILLRPFSSVTIVILKVWLSSDWKIVIVCTSGVFLVLIYGIVWRVLLSEEAHRGRIGHLWTNKLDWTVASEVVANRCTSEWWDITSCWSSTSHRRQTGWKVGIFPLKAVRGLVWWIWMVGDIVIFPLNKKIFTRNIAVCLLLKFNDLYYKGQFYL